MLGQRCRVASRWSLSVVEQRSQPVQLVDGAGQRRARPTEQVGQRRGAVVERRDRRRRWDRGPSDKPADQLLEPVDRAGELVAVLGQRVQQCSRSSISCSMTWLLSASEFVNDDVFENSDSRVAALALQYLDQRRGERVDVLRIQALDNGFQSAEQQVEVQRGRRPVHGYLRAGRQDLRRSGAVDEFEVAIADQVEVANLRLGAGGQHDVAIGVERRPAPCGPAAATRPCTVPTRMPATRTVSPVFSRDASVKTAE